MYKIVALIGEAGSGKDTVMQNILIKYPTMFNEIISCTTRPRRDNEIEGVNYFYLTPEEFSDKVLNYEMLEATSFNGWFYGTSFDSLRSDVVNIGVFNPDGIRTIISNPEVEVQVFRIAASDKTRMLRQLNREHSPNVDEIVRRYKTDKEDFSDLDFDYTEIPNEASADLTNAVLDIVELCALGQN